MNSEEKLKMPEAQAPKTEKTSLLYTDEDPAILLAQEICRAAQTQAPASENKVTAELPAATDTADSATASSPNPLAVLYDMAEILVTALLMVGLLFSMFFRTAGVDGESMMDTLQNKDYLLLYRFCYTPERGDIVVVNRYHPNSHTVQKPLIKRVIGKAGDTLRITADAVYLNGELLSEPYVHYTNWPSGMEVTVPEGKLFVMGDHRDNSKDSRSSDVGFVDEEDIMGKAVLRLAPFDTFGGLYD